MVNNVNTTPINAAREPLCEAGSNGQQYLSEIQSGEEPKKVEINTHPVYGDTLQEIEEKEKKMPDPYFERPGPYPAPFEVRYPPVTKQFYKLDDGESPISLKQIFPQFRVSVLIKAYSEALDDSLFEDFRISYCKCKWCTSHGGTNSFRAGIDSYVDIVPVPRGMWIPATHYILNTYERLSASDLASVITLLLCHDIELNPGPVHSKDVRKEFRYFGLNVPVYNKYNASKFHDDYVMAKKMIRKEFHDGLHTSKLPEIRVAKKIVKEQDVNKNTSLIMESMRNQEFRRKNSLYKKEIEKAQISLYQKMNDLKWMKKDPIVDGFLRKAFKALGSYGLFKEYEESLEKVVAMNAFSKVNKCVPATMIPLFESLLREIGNECQNGEDTVKHRCEFNEQTLNELTQNIIGEISEAQFGLLSTNISVDKDSWKGLSSLIGPISFNIKGVSEFIESLSAMLPEIKLMMLAVFFLIVGRWYNSSKATGVSVAIMMYILVTHLNVADYAKKLVDSVSVVIDHWISKKPSEMVEENVTESGDISDREVLDNCYGALASFLFVTTFGKVSAYNEEGGFMSRIDNAIRSATMVSKNEKGIAFLINGIFKVVKVVHDMVLKNWLDLDLFPVSPYKKSVLELMTVVSEIVEEQKEGKFIDFALTAKIFVADRKARDIARELVGVTDPELKQLAQDVRMVCLELRNLMNNALKKNPLAGQQRHEPFFILLLGSTQVGKSAVSNLLALEILIRTCRTAVQAAFFRKYAPHAIYNRVCDQDFWDRYTGQPVVKFDELFYQTPNQPNAGVPIRDILLCKNNQSYFTNQADLSDKGTVPFTTKLLIGTSNCFNWKTHLSQLCIKPEAIGRRMDLPIVQTVRPEFLVDATRPIQDHRVDYNKVKEYLVKRGLYKQSSDGQIMYEYVTDIYQFQVCNPVADSLDHYFLGEPFGYEEFIRRCMQGISKLERDQDQMDNLYSSVSDRAYEETFCMDDPDLGIVPGFNSDRVYGLHIPSGERTMGDLPSVDELDGAFKMFDGRRKTEVERMKAYDELQQSLINPTRKKHNEAMHMRQGASIDMRRKIMRNSMETAFDEERVVRNPIKIKSEMDDKDIRIKYLTDQLSKERNIHTAHIEKLANTVDQLSEKVNHYEGNFLETEGIWSYFTSKVKMMVKDYGSRSMNFLSFDDTLLYLKEKDIISWAGAGHYVGTLDEIQGGLLWTREGPCMSERELAGLDPTDAEVTAGAFENLRKSFLEKVNSKIAVMKDFAVHHKREFAILGTLLAFATAGTVAFGVLSTFGFLAGKAAESGETKEVHKKSRAKRLNFKQSMKQALRVATDVETEGPRVLNDFTNIAYKVWNENTYGLWMISKLGVMFHGSVTFVRQTIASMPLHFLNVLQGYYEVDKELMFELRHFTSDVKYVFKYSEFMHLNFPAWNGEVFPHMSLIGEQVEGASTDKLLVMFPPTVVAPRCDITKHFAPEHVIEKLRGRRQVHCTLMLSRWPDKSKCGERLPISIRGDYQLFSYRHRADAASRDDPDEDNPGYREEGFKYEATTTKGDCGSLLYITDDISNRPYILGRHVSGSTGFGYAGFVSQESLVEACNRLALKVKETGVYGKIGECIPSRADFDRTEAENGTFEGFSVINPDTKVSLVRLDKHEFEKSVVHPDNYSDAWKESTCDLTLLTTKEVDGVIIDPMRQNLPGIGLGGAVYFRKKVLYGARDSFRWRMNKDSLPIDKIDRRCWTLEEGWNGIEGIAHSLSRTTSAGLYYKNLATGKVRQKIVGTEGGKIDTTAPLWDHHCKKVTREWEAYCRGERVHSVQEACLKSERRTKEKVRLGKTRPFIVMDLDLLVNSRRAFGAFSAWCQHNCIDNGMTIGMNPYTQWNKLHNKLTALETKVKHLVGDYRRWDQSVLQELLLLCCEIVDSWYEAARLSDYESGKRARFAIIMDIANVIVVAVLESYKIIDGKVVFDRERFKAVFIELHGGMPSGCFLTALFGSMVNQIVIRYVLAICLEKVLGIDLDDLNIVETDKFWKVLESNFVCETNGDDNVITISEDCPVSEEEFVKQMQLIGFGYTSEDKVSALTFKNDLKTSTYLKRGFRYEPFLNEYIGHLALDVILEMLFWLRKGAGTDELANNFETAFRELSFHGKEVFNLWFPFMSRAKFIFTGLPPELAGWREYLLAQRHREDVYIE